MRRLAAIPRSLEGPTLLKGRLARKPRKQRRRRLSRDERRQRLLDTAHRVFARHGFNGTTIRQLAQAAGVTDAVIFQHFPTKAALYAAVLKEKNKELWSDDWMTALEERLDASDDVGFVRLLFANMIEQCERYPSYPRLSLYSALEPQKVTRQVQNTTVPRLQTLLKRFIRAGQEAGRFSPGSMGLFLRALLALPSYHILQQQLFHTPWQACETQEVLDAGVEFVLAGLSGIRSKGASARARKEHRVIDS